MIVNTTKELDFTLKWPIYMQFLNVNTPLFSQHEVASTVACRRRYPDSLPNVTKEFRCGAEVNWPALSVTAAVKFCRRSGSSGHASIDILKFFCLRNLSEALRYSDVVS